MKKIFTLLALFFLLIGCSGTDNVPLQFEVATADKTVTLASNENAPTCNVHLEMAYATEANGHKAEIINNSIEKRLLNLQDMPMQMAADSFAIVYVDNYQSNLQPLYLQDRGNEKKTAWYNYHYIIKTQPENGYKGTTVYHAYLDYYEGGAHGISQHLTMNFEQSTGRQLALADIFVPGYESRLCQALQKALCAYVGAANVKELKNQGYLYNLDMFPSENFVLGEEAITFIYNPYEIAPYDKGCIELTIAYSDLDDILNNFF
jgi:hypothetical protein